MCIDTSMSHVAVFDTSEDIRVVSTRRRRRSRVNNFVTLARWGYYDGTTIGAIRRSTSFRAARHRSPADPPATRSPTSRSSRKPAPASSAVPLCAGQLVMARTALPNSSSAQYFFTTGENAARLDGQGVYVVFGETGAGSGCCSRSSACTSRGAGGPVAHRHRQLGDDRSQLTSASGAGVGNRAHASTNDRNGAATAAISKRCRSLTKRPA